MAAYLKRKHYGYSLPFYPYPYDQAKQSLNHDEFMQFSYTTALKFQIQNSGVSFDVYFS